MSSAASKTMLLARSSFSTSAAYTSDNSTLAHGRNVVVSADCM